MNDNFNIETLPITEQIKTNYEDIIHLLGEDKFREGLIKNSRTCFQSNEVSDWRL